MKLLYFVCLLYAFWHITPFICGKIDKKKTHLERELCVPLQNASFTPSPHSYCSIRTTYTYYNLEKSSQHVISIDIETCTVTSIDIDNPK